MSGRVTGMIAIENGWPHVPHCRRSVTIESSVRDESGETVNACGCSVGIFAMTDNRDLV